MSTPTPAATAHLSQSVARRPPSQRSRGVAASLRSRRREAPSVRSRRPPRARVRPVAHAPEARALRQGRRRFQEELCATFPGLRVELRPRGGWRPLVGRGVEQLPRRCSSGTPAREWESDLLRSPGAFTAIHRRGASIVATTGTGSCSRPPCTLLMNLLAAEMHDRAESRCSPSPWAPRGKSTREAGERSRDVLVARLVDVFLY